MTPPKNVHDLISGTCEYVPLHSKRDFADVTKVSCDLGPTIFLDYLSGSNLITEAIKIEVEGRWVREMRQKKKEEKFRVWEGFNPLLLALKMRKEMETSVPQVQRPQFCQQPKMSKRKKQPIPHIIFTWASWKEYSPAEVTLILAQWDLCQTSGMQM